MKAMQTRKNPRCTYSKADGLRMTAPRSWRELSEDELRLVFELQAKYAEPTSVKTRLLMKLCGLRVRKKVAGGALVSLVGQRDIPIIYIATWQLQSLIHQFDYIDTYEAMGVRLARLQGLHAVDVNLHGLCYSDYVNVEKAYQHFLMKEDVRFLAEMARILYRDEQENAVAQLVLSPMEQVAVLAWWAYVKSMFARRFPHLFKPAGRAGEKLDEWKWQEASDAQLRALTDGDVTKEASVETVDCWRALTELDAKARAAAEFRAKCEV